MLIHVAQSIGLLIREMVSGSLTDLIPAYWLPVDKRVAQVDSSGISIRGFLSDYAATWSRGIQRKAGPQSTLSFEYGATVGLQRIAFR